MTSEQKQKYKETRKDYKLLTSRNKNIKIIKKYIKKT